MAVGVLAMIVVAVVAMLTADLVLAVIGLLVFPAIFGLNVVYQRLLSPLVTRAQALRAEVSEVAHESFDGAVVVKTLGRESEETERFATSAYALRDANVAVGKVRGLFDPALEALPSLGVLAVLVLGTSRILSGATDPGDVVQVAYLFTIVAFPIRAIGWVLGELPRSVVGWDRVNAVLDATGEMTYGTRSAAPTRGPAALAVSHLRFSYAEGEVLSDVDFTVAPGATVALVGPTAAGKSTLAALLVRLLDPDAGAVCVDGVDVRELGPGELARSAALVPQQTFIFDDTVRENVTLGAPLDDASVWAALRVAQADGFVARLPDGLDTRLGERGTTLSGGQRQRLALARALVRQPRLLVLDDATSAVDPDVEARILAALRDHTQGGATIVVVAYRNATIALADEVLYLEAGQIADRGRHAELAARSAGYRSLVTAYEMDAERRRVDRESGVPA
jgi:ABC-type multidrug transport system fused ATPase/permease subunit